MSVLYDTKLMVRLQSQSFGKYGVPFIALASRFTLSRIGSSCLGPIYGSNRTSQSFIKDYYYHQLFETI